MESSKKKLIHIVESFGGGVYSFLVDLINNTSDEFEITVLYGERPETPKNFKNDFNKEVKFIKIQNFTRSINFKKDLKAIKEVKQNINEINPDIIHLHSSKSGIIGRLIKTNRNVKMFYNPHGFSFLKQDDSKIKRTLYWLIEKATAILNKKCTIIGCSKGEYEEAKKLNKNSICINNGIDIEKLQKDIENLKEKQQDYNNVKICTVGRIGYQKNPTLFNEIAKAFPNIQFTWIGDGEKRKILNSDNITITGWKDRKEVLEILNDNDIFVLCSLWEGLPISLLEAMYMKKLCLVTDCIGNRDVIEDGVNGFICKNLNEYLNNINTFLKGDMSNIEIKNNVYNSISETYNIKRMLQEYKEIYFKER